MLKKIIVFGNEKGGTGKSTLAMHLVVSLLNGGYKVGTIDVDAKQGTFSRYIENRVNASKKKSDIFVPSHRAVFQSSKDNRFEVDDENRNNFSQALDALLENDYIVIDTPGHDNSLSRFAHSYADILVTPINESFVDLDLLVRLKDSVEQSKLRLSTYAETVWEQKKNKAMRNKGTIDWVVLTNRVSNVASKNRAELEKILFALSKRIGFRFMRGFKERVIFKELFVSGLTLVDKACFGTQISLSHIAARHELSDFLKTLDIV
jgi:chromosome partitioning protein